jgi:hypothetical protein
MEGTPSELATIVGLKFTFAVNINVNSYYTKERIFNVNSVIQAHGKQKEPIHHLSVAAQIQESHRQRQWRDFPQQIEHRWYIFIPPPLFVHIFQGPIFST